MKLQIIGPGETGITGYTIVQTDGNQFSGWDKVSDNECDMILANNVLDLFKIEHIPQVLQSICQKLRLNGRLTVGGTDIRLFARQIASGMLPENDACNMIGTKQSMTNSDAVMSQLNQLGLKVELFNQSGAHYELTAIRS